MYSISKLLIRVELLPLRFQQSHKQVLLSSNKFYYDVISFDSLTTPCLPKARDHTSRKLHTAPRIIPVCIQVGMAMAGQLGVETIPNNTHIQSFWWVSCYHCRRSWSRHTQKTPCLPKNDAPTNAITDFCQCDETHTSASNPNRWYFPKSSNAARSHDIFSIAALN
jgi:hypothetical protein